MQIKKAILFLCASLVSFSFYAQNNIWTKTKNTNFEQEAKVKRNSQPNEAVYFNLNINSLKAKLLGAPVRGQFTGQSNLIISFPNADGNMEQFRVMESPIMHPDLAAKYPMIKTYCAQGVDDPTATMRFSITQFGFHSMVVSGKHSANYIDPYTTNSNTHIVYYKN